MTMPKRICLLIFDLDGTLVDAYPAICQSFHYSMAKLGLPSVDDESIRRAVGWGERKLFEPFVPEDKLDEMSRIYREHHLKALESGVVLMPGAQEMLTQLKDSQYKLAVASNRPTRTSKAIIDTLQIAHFFDCVMCGDQINKFKPDPGILNHILNQLSLSTEQAFYIGDMAIDAEAGQRAGVKTIIVTTGSSSRKEIEEAKPYKIVDKISSVMTILRENETGSAVSE